MMMLRTLRALILCGLLLPASFAGQEHKSSKSKPATVPGTTTVVSGDPGHTVTGWVDIIPFTSKIFHNTRMLRVWTPGNYLSPHNASRKYPVLYLQDGQALFDDATAGVSGEWHVDESVDHLVGSFKIPPMIMVGIDNAGQKRANEYLPYPDPGNKQAEVSKAEDVQGKEYVRFLITEVMPFVEKHYRVATGAANTSIGGAGYGGAVSLYAALEHPTVFGKVLIQSPTLWIGDQQLLNDAKKAKQLPRKMYVGVGSQEFNELTWAPDIVERVQDLEKILREKGMGHNRLMVVIDEGAHYNEAAWSKRAQDALLFMFEK